MSTIEPKVIKNIIEAALLAAGQPLPLERIAALFIYDETVQLTDIQQAIAQLMLECADRGVELKEVGSGYRMQAKQDYAPWLVHLWEEKPPRYSRAVLETLVLIAYRQPITRGEIEDVRGVSVSSHIVKTLQEREWVRVVGHRDVPGRPALYATTKGFLDYFNLRSLDELPSLAEIKDLDNINAELALAAENFAARSTDRPENEFSDAEEFVAEALFTGAGLSVAEAPAAAYEEPSAGEEPAAGKEPSAQEARGFTDTKTVAVARASINTEESVSISALPVIAE